MPYTLKIESQAKKDIKSLELTVQKRIVKKLKFFLEKPDPLMYAKKLVDSSGGDYRWRIGNYRLIFDLKDYEILLLRVQHRKDVYNK